MIKLTQEFIRSLFDYKEGNLYWKNRTSNKSRIKIGFKAGTLNNRSYYQTGINDKIYLNHRLIFLYHKGYLPKFIDHIDRNPLNNNIENLRETTLAQNQYNQQIRKNSSSIYKGVSWYKTGKKWIAQIIFNKKHYNLGYFINEKDAALVYNKKAKELFGEFANLNEVILL